MKQQEEKGFTEKIHTVYDSHVSQFDIQPNNDPLSVTGQRITNDAL